MKKPTKSIITSSLLALAFGALSVGSTFALFTSQAKTEINVGAGEVRVGQTLEIRSVSELGDVAVTPINDVYTNSIGGKTYIDSSDANLLHLENWVPGDKAIIKVTNNNYSNVTIKTRFTVSHTSTSTPDLFNALTLNYLAKDANDNDIGYKFMDWSPVEPSVSKISDVYVTIEFPDGDNGEILFGDENHDNQYQNCNCSIMFTQEAVQGNAHTNGILDQLNAALDTAAATDGRNKTMYDALQDVSSIMGEPLIKSAGYVWNTSTDHFYYGQEGTTNEYFKIYDAMPETQTNSIYASSTWSVATVNLTGVGFDAGSASGITTINYVGASEARSNVIRTNSAATSVNVDAPQDTISHYGLAGSLNINAVAGNSYHEYGQVAFAEIATGRIVLESNSKVEHIHLNTSEVNSETVFNNITVAKASDVQMPDFSRDPIEINETEGTLVVALQNGTETTDDKDYVWLTAVGIYEQVTVSSSETEAGNNYAADSNDQEKKDTAQQIANNISVEVDGDTYTVKAEKTSSGWDYVLVDEEKQVSEEYSVSGTPVVNVSTDEETAITTTTVTVSVVDANEAPVTSATSAIENGSDAETEKNEFVATLIMNKAELDEFFSGKLKNGKLGANIVSSEADDYCVSTGEKNLDFNGFTIENIQMQTATGGKLGLIGGGALINNSDSPIVVKGGTLSLGISVSTEGNDAIQLKDAEFTLILCGASVETNGDPLFPTAPGTIIIADDTDNLLKTTYSGYNAAAIRFIANEEFADENDNVYWSIIGQEKGNGILRTESDGYGIQLYGASAVCNLTMENFCADICGNRTAIYEGVNNHAIMRNMTGGFSDDQTRFCEPGYFTDFNPTMERYIFTAITESNASILVTNGNESVYAINFVQALLLAEDNATVKLLKDVNNTTAFERVTAEHITIDLNGKTLTSSTTIGVNRNSSFNSNVCAPIYVTFSNGIIDSDVRFEENANVVFNNVQFINNTTSLKKVMLYSDLNRNVYPEADPSYQSMTFNGCTFTNYYFEFSGRNEAQHMDVSFTNCTFNKNVYTNKYSDNSLIKFGDNYGYGTLSLDGCVINADLKNSYNYAVEVNTYASYIGEKSVVVNVKNSTINVTGGCTKPINAGTWTVNEEGTNVYTVGGNAKNYDGSAIE